MRKLFQNSAVFYSSLVVVAIALQWWVAGRYEPELRAADREAEKPLNQIREHYNDPRGVPSEIVTLDLEELRKKVFDGYKKFQELVVFKASEDYRVDPKSSYPGIEFQERVKKFRAKNAKRLKELGNRLNATFLSGNLIEPSPEKVAGLLHQATILEELLARLEVDGLVAAIDNIQVSPPREEQQMTSVGLIKKVVRYPVLLELTADPGTLDRVFKAALGGKTGLFFLEELEFSHGNDPENWGQEIRSRLSLAAFSMNLEEYLEAPPETPAWAVGIGR